MVLAKLDVLLQSGMSVVDLGELWYAYCCRLVGLGKLGMVCFKPVSHSVCSALDLLDRFEYVLYVSLILGLLCEVLLHALIFEFN